MKFAKIVISFLALILLLPMSIQSAQAVTVLHGFTFQDNAFADTLLSDPSGFTVSGAPDAASALTGADTSSFAFNAMDGTGIKLGFTDNTVVNGPGVDLIVFELNVLAAEPIVATINGVQSAPQAQLATGSVFPPNGTIHYTAWDLTDFGVAIGGSVSSVMLSGVCTAVLVPVYSCTQGALVASAFLAVGALNSGPAVVPLPGAVWLLALGVLGLGMVGRRRRG